ncbi:hypothetical protein [Altererythrobacter lutimaris]|uniref:Uncharacterized protein n=1 Tax=Altererythrobacter lutimaris TaxID=2743979 RepID=A0A850HAA8_9SPHN|nr:hypothetical protein [Altererythrobacter lutimaris]NVE93388.1 hypothetical protein [Altererythrobacter lutimaris]
MAELGLSDSSKAEIERRWPAIPLWRVERIAEVYKEDLKEEVPEWRDITATRASLTKLQSDVEQLMRQLKRPSPAVGAILGPFAISKALSDLDALNALLENSEIRAPKGTAQKWWRRYMVEATRSLVEEALGHELKSASIALVQIIINHVEDPDFTLEQAQELVKQY